jgi:hypothetical protein
MVCLASELVNGSLGKPKEVVGFRDAGGEGDDHMEL